MSFLSIAKLADVRVCVLVDDVGMHWCEELIEEVDEIEVCIHHAPLSILKKLEIADDVNSMREFGQKQFIRLTPLKWYLLSDCLSKHKDVAGIWFSDLDVLWTARPTITSCANQKISAQNDAWRGSQATHFCTGIMYWPQSSKSIHFLEKLFLLQVDRIFNGILVPDEPTFNEFFSQQGFRDDVRYLDRNDYVIGHRILWFLLSKRKTLHQVTAFHFNYLIGDDNKLMVAQAVSNKLKGGYKWTFVAFRLISTKLYSRLISLCKNLSKVSAGSTK